jgi:hypothetical protein
MKALLLLRDLQLLNMSFCDLSGSLDSSLTRPENLSVIIFCGNSYVAIARNVLISNNNIVIEEYIYTSCPILAQNKFYGPIECPATDDIWHMLQIIDLAFNNFSGKLPGKFFTRWEAMMSDNDQTESKINHIRFQVLHFGQIYYRIQ